jgi:hypothetical protein
MNKHIIYYPNRLSEFEIQSDIYQRIKQSGLEVKGEVKAKNSRLDLVVYDANNNAICIIEVKSRARARTTEKKYKRVQKYEQLFNLPVIVCTHPSQIEQTVNKVKELLNA